MNSISAGKSGSVDSEERWMEHPDCEHRVARNHPVLVGDLLLVRNGEEMAAFRLSLAGR